MFKKFAVVGMLRGRLFEDPQTILGSSFGNHLPVLLNSFQFNSSGKASDTKTFTGNKPQSN